MLPVPADLLDPLPLSGKSSARALWMRKTPNLFRGVVEVDCATREATEVNRVVREVVKAEYEPGLVVPFAFGTVLNFERLAPSVQDLEIYVADRVQRGGTWQWLVVVDQQQRTATGVHMWMPGYLTPVYERLLQHFAAIGYACESSTRKPGKFWQRLWATLKGLHTAQHLLSTVGVAVVLALTVVALLIGR
jgi:hypothetical protein